MRFSLYGTQPSKGRDTIEIDALVSLATEGGVIALAEDSGNEGCYVEVARWKDGADCHSGQWCRFAFLKCFGGEDVSGDIEPFGKATNDSRATAQRIAAIINDKRPYLANLIHRLPNYKEKA